MARTTFTIDEMVYNTVLAGKSLYYNNELKTIDYVKVVKDTRQLQIICLPDNNNQVDVFLVNQDDPLDFEVNNPKSLKTPNKPKLSYKRY